MFKIYQPIPDELEMAKLKSLILPNANPTNEKEIIGQLVLDILRFDYYYHYSDDITVWRSGETMSESIKTRLSELEDTHTAEMLSHCFNKDNHTEVISCVPWGKYINKITPYVRLRFNGIEHEEACKLIGVSKLIDGIVDSVITSGVQGHVLYATHYKKVAPVLREGLQWFDKGILRSAAVNDQTYTALKTLVELYQSREINYVSLKLLYPFNIEVMLTEHAEFIRIRNFYVAVSY